MTHWKDSTSYSRNQTDRVPTSFTADVGSLRITVVSNHRANPGFWSVHCHQIGMDTKDLGLPNNVSAETAQKCAVDMVHDELMRRLRDVRRLM